MGCCVRFDVQEAMNVQRCPMPPDEIVSRPSLHRRLFRASNEVKCQGSIDKMSSPAMYLRCRFASKGYLHCLPRVYRPWPHTQRLRCHLSIPTPLSQSPLTAATDLTSSTAPNVDMLQPHASPQRRLVIITPYLTTPSSHE